MIKTNEQLERDIENELTYVATYASTERRKELLLFLKSKFKEWNDYSRTELLNGILEEVEKMKEVAQFGRETSWQIEHANGYNKAVSDVRAFLLHRRTVWADKGVEEE